MSDPGTATSRYRLARPLGWFAVLSLVAAAFAPSAFAADKVTICHATGSETNPYNPITVDAGASYFPHLDSNGTPLSGHEQDFLLPKAGFDADCNPVAVPAPTPTPVPAATPTPTPVVSVQLPNTATDAPTAAQSGTSVWPIALAALAGLLASVFVLSPAFPLLVKRIRR
jgi:hypothetical protein